jgi:hypothetical protein
MEGAMLGPVVITAGLLALLAGLPRAACADVTLPGLISDGMVLQQRTPVRLFGNADPGEVVTVSLQNQTGRATTGADGRWMVTLPAAARGRPVHNDDCGQKPDCFKQRAGRRGVGCVRSIQHGMVRQRGR